MSAADAVPAVVSKRNQFDSAEELVEGALPYLPEQFKHPAFKSWLQRYTETVIHSVGRSFSVAAERGIQQATELLCDPEYYATKRQRRARERRRWEEDRAKQEMERIECMSCPTAEQIGKQIVACEHHAEYHREQLALYEKSLERLHAMVPKNIRLVPTKKIK
jgi:hypothetical protein